VKTKRSPRKEQFALCVKNEACEDLEIRKVYRVLPDRRAEKDGYLRVVDESGEDYLYPESYLVLLHLPQKARLLVAAEA
jgi:hypothetical protein